MDHLFFQESLIKGNDLHLIFHKDYPYNYNPETYPVVKYSLINCRNIESYDLASYAADFDGISIEVQNENSNTKLILTDVSDTEIIIVCDKVLKEDIKYREEDFIHLIKEILKQRDEGFDSNTKSLNLIFEVKYFMEKEILIIDRKINEAQWISDEKRQFLEGQKNIMLKILEIIDFPKTR